jgi:hypothetical protein
VPGRQCAKPPKAARESGPKRTIASCAGDRMSTVVAREISWPSVVVTASWLDESLDLAIEPVNIRAGLTI